jgi:hypothetical protein
VIDPVTVALKEWELQIAAMLRGEQLFLLRKGGILESTNQFELEHPRFVFFPTVVHQDARMVREPWRGGIRQVREEPSRVSICAYGESVRIFEVPSRSALRELADLYIWDEPLLEMRFAYRPEKPLYLVLVRAFALPGPIELENTLEYAGCRSWVPLAEGVEVSSARQAVAEERLVQIEARVEEVFRAARGSGGATG